MFDHPNPIVIKVRKRCSAWKNVVSDTERNIQKCKSIFLKTIGSWRSSETENKIIWFFGFQYQNNVVRLFYPSKREKNERDIHSKQLQNWDEENQNFEQQISKQKVRMNVIKMYTLDWNKIGLWTWYNCSETGKYGFQTCSV